MAKSTIGITVFLKSGAVFKSWCRRNKDHHDLWAIQKGNIYAVLRNRKFLQITKRTPLGDIIDRTVINEKIAEKDFEGTHIRLENIQKVVNNEGYLVYEANE